MQAGGCGFEPRYLHQKRERVHPDPKDSNEPYIDFASCDDSIDRRECTQRAVAANRSLTTEYETLGKHSEDTLEDQVSVQATKGARWMPWHEKAMKDVVSCDKPR